MSLFHKNILAGASGAGGAGEATYVDDVFSTFLYDGSGSTRDIVNGIDLDGEGGLVWIKGRDNNRNHQLFDTERGVNNTLISNSSDAAVFDAGGRKLQAFNDDGFELGSDALVNSSSGESFCSWTFRKAPGFFDVVTYTGNGTSGRTVSHNLGSVPGCIMIKRLDVGTDWLVYHRGLDSSAPEDYRIVLNSNAARESDEFNIAWNSTAPTATEFTLGTYSRVNANGGTYVAYIFAHDDQSFGTDSDEAIIKCGSFTTNSSSEATVNLGFEPQWFMFKRTDSTGDWYILDTMRGFGAFNNDTFSEANTNDADNLSRWGEPTATGWTNVGSTMNFGSSQTYIYVAIRRPHKPPEAGTDVFNTVTYNGDGSTGRVITTNVLTDAFLSCRRNSGSLTGKHHFYDRIRGDGGQLRTYATSGEFPGSDSPEFDLMNGINFDGYTDGAHNATGGQYVLHAFRRAPGFFDVVGYAGDGSTTTASVSHSLGVSPELLIIKSRSSSTYSWGVRTVGSGALDRTGLALNYSTMPQNSGFGTTGISAAAFNPYYVAGNDGSNSNYGSNAYNLSGTTYIAYLFATLSGISKVGTYSGSSSDVQVDCGFTAGARFVLIKRIDGIGDWCLFDTARGIVSGNDPKLTLNGASAEDTGNDLIDPLSSGFTVVGGNSFINGAGRSYIYLAIA